MNRNDQRYHARIQQNTPGKYGYRCRCCGRIAFAFVGDEAPIAGDYLENYEISQRGAFPSIRGNKLRCQACNHLVSAANGILNPDCVIVIDEFVAELDKQRQQRGQQHVGRVRQAGEPEVTRESLGCGLTIQERAERDRARYGQDGLPKGAPAEAKAAATRAPRGDRDPDTLPADQLDIEELRYRAHKLGLDTTLDRNRLLPLVQEKELETALDAE